ncbi:starch-binding protein [Butyrivibrio sp. FC2001]|uniref:starch-binding protein n=1 Tax=Butyrivibrio sp. FC2001 TaxID=1280671 RepID=UPI0006855587|nr:starch-binding protein [Butyrivibrio sp. FC2001]
MRKGKHVVKRLMTVWLSAALAMGAPGASLVSMASGVEDVAIKEDSRTSENDVTDTGEKVPEGQEENAAEDTISDEEKPAEDTTSDEEKPTDDTTSDEEKVAEDATSNEEKTDEDTSDTTDVETEEADNASDDETIPDDDPETYTDRAVKGAAPAADDTDDAEAKKQKAKDSQKHEKENISNSASVNRASIHDGAILHAFCWNFNTIKENMAAIAEAGFTAVQTSPINACLDTHNALSLNGDINGTDGMWYYHYQPTDWTIGNYQLGSREEFKEMCNEADKYGIGVIVDILPNHTTPTDSEISQNLIDAAGGWDNLFHKDYKQGISSYNDRASVTYNAMGGLYDVDTENTDFQDYFYAYLDDCVNCGADGFRIDTAKHIALPDDPVPSNYAGDEGRNTFYPNMAAALDAYAAETGNGKNYDNLFVYGEVLQGDGDRLAAYQKYIGGTTASNYGGSIRSAVSSDNVSAGKLVSYSIYDEANYAADANRLVTWVESHDNYINDKSYQAINDQDTLEAWAIITARKDGTPLFFSRPSGSSAENPFGDNVIGQAGNALYKSPEVTAVNRFRTAMNGKGENLSNPGGDMHVIMVERGDAAAEGAVLVNTASYPVAISGDTTLPDGNYVNKVEGRNDLFTVKNGKIDGVIQKEAVVVLTEATTEDYTTIHFNNSFNWNNVQAIIDGETTVDAISENDGWFRVNVARDNFSVVFTNGTDKTECYEIKDGAEGFITPEKKDIYASKADTDEALGLITASVYLLNTDLWQNANIYSWFDGGDQLAGGWPGKNTYDEGGYWIRADLKLPKDRKDEAYSVIFNADGVQTVDFKISGLKNYLALMGKNADGKWALKQFDTKEDAEKETGISANSTTVYFYNKDNWDTVSAYTWEAYSFGDWPGTPCEEEGEGWWKITVPAAAGANFRIIFNNGGKGSQTSDLTIVNIKNRFVYDDRTFESKEAALGAPEEEIVPAYPEGTPVTRIYYYDDNNWGKVHAYVWANVPEYNNLIGGWPGTRMYSGEDGWYYTDVPTEGIEKGDLKVIFNRAGSSQLDDKMLVDTENVYFNTPKEIGYASKDAAIKGKTDGEEEPTNPGDDKPETPGEDTPANPDEPGTVEPETPSNETPSDTKPSDSKPEDKTPTVNTEEKTVSVTGIKLNKKKVKIGKTGKFQLEATVEPENATNKDITWTSSDEKIAQVSAEGLVTAKKKGSCVVTATTKDGQFKAECKVTVTKKVNVTGVKLNKSKKTLKKGKTVTLKATLKPKKATNQDVKWSSSNKKVATVDENGKVAAVGSGEATITVTTKEGSYKATCKITVKKDKTKKSKKKKK